MSRRAAGALTAVGALLLGLSLVGLFPMLREGLAARELRQRFTVERMPVDEGPGGGDAAPLTVWGPTMGTFRCDGRTVLVGELPPERIRTAAFVLQDHETGERRCGLVYQLPSAPGVASPDPSSATDPRGSGAPAGGQEGWTASSIGRVLAEEIMGRPPEWMRRLRFGMVSQPAGGGPLEQREVTYEERRDVPGDVWLVNLVAPTAVGIHNQSLSYWPPLILPLTYPFASVVAGALLTFVGLLGLTPGRAPEVGAARSSRVMPPSGP